MPKKSRFKKTNWKSSVKRDNERQKAASSSFGYLKIPGGMPMFNPPPGGRVKFDILPYIVTAPNHPDRYEEEGVAVEDSLWYKRPIHVHRNVGTKKDACICPRSIGKKCPICDYREKRLKEGADWEEVKDLKPSLRNLYIVVPKRSKDFEDKPHIWDVSQFLFQNLLNEELAENEDNLVFPSLEDGKTLSVRFDSSTIGDSKPFAEASRIDFDDRKKGYDESILDEIPSLDDILDVLPYAKLEAKFMELDDEDIADVDDEIEDEEDEEEEPPRRKKTASKKPVRKAKPAPKDEDEDEEEDFDDEDEEEFDDEDEEEEFEQEDLDDEDEEDPFDEEEEEDEDFDDEDFDDEDEEEEEPPKAKRTAKPKSRPAAKPTRTKRK